MKVTVAGATVDRRFWVNDPAATPETISAAYARISHSPKGLPELRDEAVSQVEKARRSNENIVYRMGHSSVAEHAVFNIDVEDCSRLLVEFIEHHRLASYTERSQRYVFFGNKTFVVPEELRGAPFEAEVVELEKGKFDLYCQVSSDEALKERFGEKLLEQARYVLGLTCPTDIGLTVNAREAEHIIAQGAAHPLAEVREFSKLLLERTGKLAPSLIKYTEGCSFVQRTDGEIAGVVRDLGTGPRQDSEGAPRPAEDRAVAMCSPCGEGPETEVAAALLFEKGGMPMKAAREYAKSMTEDQMKALFLPVFRNYPVHSSLPRAFEMMDLTFELTISASGFAQLKRHRMATLLVQPYDPEQWETPEVYLASEGLNERYNALMRRSRDLHDRIYKDRGMDVAQYVLTNAHKRRVVLKANLRELYHLVRLRSDMHAQDEIRSISDMMVALMKERYPLVTLMLCGKDGFDDGKERLTECAKSKDAPTDGPVEGKR